MTVYFVKLPNGSLVGTGGSWALYRARNPDTYKHYQPSPFIRKAAASAFINSFRLEGASIVSYRLVEVGE